MALIQCPECGKEISDKATACIHCGYPLEKQKETSQFYKIVLKDAGTDKVKVIKTIREITNLGLTQAKDIVDNPPKLIVSGLVSDDAQIIANKFSAVGALASIENDIESSSRNDIIPKMKEREKQKQDNMNNITMPIRPENKLDAGGLIMSAFFIILGLLFVTSVPVLTFILAGSGIFVGICFVKQSNDRYKKELFDYNLAISNFEEYQKQKVREQNSAAMKRAIENSKKVRCPICGTIEVEKITTASRAVSVAIVGVASNKIGKQYKCKKCKHMW